ncbi:DMT family transporter [Leeia sp. TBRC 13508]|uniref:DMT family transporter n=1 Tax=Leeia speluncae TaxID=2884804 RepID=A0ABS8D7R0_9NEIS|nr:DMT family transporter [Leeia speluncae]MCB6184244.1 DMT family transporter [Leeia speluncae]
MSHKHSIEADLLMILVTLIAAAGWIFSLKTMEVMPPLLFLGVRFLIAGIVVGSFGWKQFATLSKTQLKFSFLIGGIMSLAMMCWMVGLYHATHVGVGAFITSLGMVIAPILGMMMFKTKLSTLNWVAAAIAAVGLGCLSLSRGISLSFSDTLFLASAFGFAIQFNLNSHYAKGMPVTCLTGIQLALTGLVSLICGSFTETYPAHFGHETLLWLLASILVATSLRFFLQIKAQGMTPVKHAALIMTLEPVWTSLLAAWWLHDKMNGTQVFGCVLIFVALLVGRLGR